jgi:hypothetical protein
VYAETNGLGSIFCEGQPGTLILGGTYDVAPTGNGLHIYKDLADGLFTLKIKDTNADVYTVLRGSAIQQTFLGGRNRYINVPTVAFFQEFLSAAGLYQWKDASDNIFLQVDIESATGNKIVATPYGIKVGGGTALTKMLKGTFTVNPTSISANTVSEQSFTLSGAAVGDAIRVHPPAAGLTAGVVVSQAYVSATDTVKITFWNSTGSPIDEGSASWIYSIIRS